MTTYKVPSDTLSEFQSNPWTSTFVTNKDYTAIETTSRRPKDSTGEDAFLARTIATQTTIPHCLTLRLNNDLIVTPPTTPPTLPQPPAQWPAPTKSHKPDIITLFHFAEPGINGHTGVAHGGVISTLLDEIMSLAVAAHIPGYDFDQQRNRGSIYTMQLDVRFKRPVAVSAKAVLKAWCVASEGRKFWMRGRLVQEEEEEKKGGGGHLEWARRKVVCAEAMGFFILTRDEKL